MVMTAAPHRLGWLARAGSSHVAFGLLGAWLFLGPLLPRQEGLAVVFPFLLSALLYGWCAYALQLRNHALKAASFTDPLTGLANRRAFEWRLGSELLALPREKAPLAVVTLDVDLLKHINDKLGHAVGDRALRMVADSIRGASRVTDLPARLGGDEFAVLAPQTSAEEAAIMARRIQDALRALPAAQLHGHKVTASAGISSTEMATCTDAPGLMATADAALYEAKRRGRNQLEIGRSSQVTRARWTDAHPEV